MLSSEKRSLLRFLAIYLSSTLTLFLLATVILYHYQRHNIIDRQIDKIHVESQKIVQKLRVLHSSFNTPLVYPYHKPFKSAIYNINKEYIFGSFHPKNISLDKEFYIKNNKLFYIYKIKPYYLGAYYLVVSNEIDQKPIHNLQKLLALFLLIALIFFTLLGIFLGRLFVAPMKESMDGLNRFIQDTTHELNTPISTILTNIELLDTIYSCEGKKEMKRIEIASKTLSRLYEDLTYLKLNHNYHRDIKSINITQIIYERIDFFSTMIEAKSLKLKLMIEPNIILDIDKNDAIRLIDNILSNAIKYNSVNGDLIIELNSKKFEVYNSGIGIKAEDLKTIHRRFSRANQSEGGFGIGLDIIHYIIKQYNFHFSINSIENRYTKVTIKW
ncbi:MAG: HAMP domain-containing histidine kinase [Epsilonproteobacteria bacterium]|nr:HAMP domain-containing histidine kinase [Campylobacterota bacterium]